VEGNEGHLGKCVKAYLNIKTKRAELSADFDTEDTILKDQQELIKTELLGYLKENDLKSVKTEAGTFYKTVKTRYWTSDWEQMHKFVLEHKVPEFLEKRLSQGVVKQFLEENPEVVPKGLNSDSEFAVTVRKSK
jgi:hypothetical protein|tara:strand:- start:325 stop:726 length:402 start_codon:yes stop_codon:yes gene_type:complete